MLKADVAKSLVKTILKTFFAPKAFSIRQGRAALRTENKRKTARRLDKRRERCYNALNFIGKAMTKTAVSGDFQRTGGWCEPV